MQPNLKQIHQQVNRIIPAINQLLVKKFSLPKKISYKVGGIDHLGTSIVTETDREIETILKTKLTKILPGSGFIGEETASDVQDYNWIIDPIDGTLNFANQVPVFACSIALWYKNEPIYSLVTLPLISETVHSFTGQGIYLNGQPVKLMRKNTRKLFITYSSVGNSQEQIRILQTILQFTTSPRSYGSCVFHGVQISLGRIDAGVFINQALWDIAAIVLLAKEAGLSVKYISKEPNISRDDLKNYQHSLIIGSNRLVQQLYDKLKA